MSLLSLSLSQYNLIRRLEEDIFIFQFPEDWKRKELKKRGGKRESHDLRVRVKRTSQTSQTSQTRLLKMLRSILAPRDHGGIKTKVELASRLRVALWQSQRLLSTDLRSVVAEKIPAQQERLKAIKKNHGSKVIGEVNVGMCIGGMRGIKVRSVKGFEAPKKK